MITGPENMPVFSDNQLTPDEKKAITRYIRYTTHESKNPGGAGLGRYGPVPEGLLIFLVEFGIFVLDDLPQPGGQLWKLLGTQEDEGE